MLNASASYDNAYAYDNVYGHVVSLLANHVAAQDNTLERDVHLDIGCGYGRIAEALTSRLGLHYVGVDGEPRGLTSLRARGFEAHETIFAGKAELLAALRTILGGRRLASISMLDTLEHLPDGDEILRALRELAHDFSAPVVITVPNVAHRDIGFRLALGQWDYTADGLLDHTHTRLFNLASLKRALRFAGLHPVAFNNVRRTRSDQCFPTTLPSLATGTSLHQLLDYLRHQADDDATVNQFVVLTLPGPSVGDSAYLAQREEDAPRPFLSIVTRTQGKRPHCLVELLTALAGQEDRDFELLIVAHKVSVAQQIIIEQTIEDCPEWLRRQIRLLREYEGNRSRPLNAGFAAARGQYIAIHDDDDLPFAHWVSTFRELAESSPGAVLRSVSARQDTDIVEVNGRKAVRATSTFSPYPAEFDLISHLSGNSSPNNTLAFPRGVFHDLNLRFDESLDTTEDWDFLVRAAAIVGVASSPAITSIYRWWDKEHQSSRTDHDPAEWDENYFAVLRKFDAMPIILPPGAARRLRGAPGQPASASGARSEYHEQARLILNSSCWKATAPLRWAARLAGKPATIRSGQLDSLDPTQVATLLAALRSSRSWRVTRFIHRDKGL